MLMMLLLLSSLFCGDDADVMKCEIDKYACTCVIVASVLTKKTIRNHVQVKENADFFRPNVLDGKALGVLHGTLVKEGEFNVTNRSEEPLAMRISVPPLFK